MTMTSPAWLSRRGGDLKVGSDGKTWFVLIHGEPHYRLEEVPVQGRHGCAIYQTINGRRINSSGMYPSSQEAIQGGLEDLRKALGWE